MSVLHRALFTWFTFLVFLILLVLRIDNRTQWNWFVVFIPIWIFNAILLIFSVFDTVSSCKSRAFNRHVDVSMNFNFVAIVILKVVFEITLCLKLELPSLNLSIIHILCPLWIVLPVLSIHIFICLDSFKFETSVWCLKGLNDTKVCKFKNICYDSQFKTFLFFLHKNTVIKGFKDYTELQKLQLSSVQQHNQFYANISIINTGNFKLTKRQMVTSKGFVFSRFKPNNIMHSIHDDIFPVFLTLDHICLGDSDCIGSYTLLFHDNYPIGPFFNLYKLFSRDVPIILNELDSNVIFCLKEMIAGLILDGIFYQYGFKQPHGPVKAPQLTQNDFVRFTSFIKEKFDIKQEENAISKQKVILLKREKNRKILNVDKVKKMVTDVYKRLNKEVEVNVLSLNSSSSDLKSLIIDVSQSDGLIGMHGAEMILSLFLKSNSYIFELFPFAINPQVVSFIKSISELDGCHFSYFPWRNNLRNNSVSHPDAHPNFGGISHLDKVTQDKIRKVHDVPPVECCNNPMFLYYMYQDTFVSDDFRNYLYESLGNVLSHEKDLKPSQILKNWFYPNTVYNISCSFQLAKHLLNVNWYPPFNVENKNDLWYSLYIQEPTGLFIEEIKTDKTTIEIVVPIGVNPLFEGWISVHFKSNNFKSPDLYIKCY